MHRALRIAACFVVLVSATVSVMAQEGSSPRVTLTLESASIADALKLLFRSTGYNYTLDESVVQGYVTVSLKDVTFETALRTILRAANPPLTYRVDGGVYIISPKVETYESTPEPQVEEPSQPQVRTEKITLQHLDSLAIAQVLGGGAVSLNQSGWTYSGGGYGGFGGGYGGFGGGFGGGYGGFGGGYGGFGGGYGGFGGGGWGGGLGGWGGGGWGGGFNRGGFGGGWGGGFNRGGGWGGGRGGF